MLLIKQMFGKHSVMGYEMKIMCLGKVTRLFKKKRLTLVTVDLCALWGNSLSKNICSLSSSSWEFCDALEHPMHKQTKTGNGLSDPKYESVCQMRLHGNSKIGMVFCMSLHPDVTQNWLGHKINSPKYRVCTGNRYSLQKWSIPKTTIVLWLDGRTMRRTPS